MSQMVSPITSDNSDTIQKIDTISSAASAEISDKMVSREPSSDLNEALNNVSSEPNPAFPSSEGDVGFIGEFMLKDEPEKRQRPTRAKSFSKKLRSLSLGKIKVKPSDISANDDDSDDDSVGLMSTGGGGGSSSGRSGRGRSSRLQMREALETGSENLRKSIRSKSPSVLRRLRPSRRQSDDSHMLHDDDDDHNEQANELANVQRESAADGQPQEILLSGTDLVEDQVDDDLSDDQDTVYSQFQPSLNLSLRAERSLFVTNDDSSRHKRSVGNGIDVENNGDPMVVVVTNNDFANSTASEASLDFSVQSEANETNNPETDSAQKAAARRSPKRERGTLTRRQGGNRLSVSPKRNPRSPVRPKRHSTTTSTIPTRHSSVPKNAVSAAMSPPIDERASLTSKQEKSPKREKTPKKDKSDAAVKREKSPKRERDKKKERRKSIADKEQEGQ